jgi:hypothetical protein
MPQWLTKEYGPFTGTVWVVVIVGGVGLGLLMRRFMGGREPADSYTTTDPGFTGTSPVSSGTGTFYNQGEIVAGVLEAINAQQGNPPPATTQPAVTVGAARDWGTDQSIYGDPNIPNTPRVGPWPPSSNSPNTPNG